MELWLDLRQTALPPHVAVERLHNDLQETVVDRVLVSTMSTTTTTSPVPSELCLLTVSPTLTKGEGEMPLVSLTSPCQQVLRTDSSGMSVPFGILTTTNTNENDNSVDPMVVINAASKGEWLVVDKSDGQPSSTDVGETSDFQNAVESVLQFFPFAGVTAMEGSESNDNGENDDDDDGPTLLLVGPQENGNGSSKDKSGESGQRGGVAWTCSTNGDILHAATIMAQSSSSLGSEVATESGILLASSADSSEDTPCSKALVLPFDEQLWESAMMLIQ